MPKTLLLLLDGTGNDAASIDEEDETFSNVYAINQLIAESAKVGRKSQSQITFYLPGIGTKFCVRRYEEKKRLMTTERVRQLVFGDGLEQLILRSYINICANYKAGDKLVLIGFSRGAVAARILSRLVSDVGVLKAQYLSYLETLWNTFCEKSSLDTDESYLNELAAYRKELAKKAGEEVFIESISIDFLGVFDTVVGPYDVGLSKYVKLRDQIPAKAVKAIVHLVSMHDIREHFVPIPFEPGNAAQTNLRQIWMPGVHSDIGGGYVHSFIANVSLLTMAYFANNIAGIALHEDAWNALITRIRRQIELAEIRINKEPQLINKSDQRKKLISAQSELHPLHKVLVGRNVQWKSDKVEKYQDLNEYRVEDSVLDREVRNWLGIAQVEAKGPPRKKGTSSKTKGKG